MHLRMCIFLCTFEHHMRASPSHKTTCCNFEHLPWLLFYVCANPPSGDLSGAALEVPSEALLHPRSYCHPMQPMLQILAHNIYKKTAAPYHPLSITSFSSKLERVMNIV